MANLSALILAAGKGTRMKSQKAKVLHALSGIPMIDHVMDALTKAKVSQFSVVVGHQADEVRSHLKALYPKVNFARQEKLNGSGGAVRSALSWIRKQNGVIIVACGDAPLMRPETIKNLVKAHQRQKNEATVLTAQVPYPSGYGRIVRKSSQSGSLPNQSIAKIVEELDATPHEKNINEINTGTYCFKAKTLARLIPKLKNNNAKKEYYLTDVIELINSEGGRVGASVLEDSNEALGINSRIDLALAQYIQYSRKRESLMQGGVTIVDPETVYIDADVQIGADTVIYPQTLIRGKTLIGRGCQIGPQTLIADSRIGENVQVQFSVVESGIVKNNAKIGPFSRIRPGAVLGEDTHLGNFSEVKKSRIGKGSKINHLSYIGDAKVGKNVNIGAGTITCNYDGFRKHPTTIQDHAFIGSNVNLVAPIKVGAGAVVGAGSTLSQNVPNASLAVERAELKVKLGWAKQRKNKK